MLTPDVRDHEDDARRRLAFLAEATSAFSSSLSFDVTAESLANAVVPYLADWCTVRLLDQGNVTAATRAHAEGVDGRLFDELIRRYPPDRAVPTGIRHVLDTGEPFLIERVEDEDLLQTADDEEHADIVRRLGIGSLLVVPLVARDKQLGALTLVRTSVEDPYTSDDVDLASEVARRAALALDNALLFRDVREANLRLQALVHSLNAILWEAQPDPFRFTFVSHQVEEILGYPVERWLDDPGFWQEIMHPEDRARASAHASESIRAGRDYEVEYRITDAADTLRYMREIAHVETDDDGRTINIRAITLDETKRKRAEQRTAAEHATAEALATSTTIQEASPKLLWGIAGALGWEVGALWLVDEASGVLRCADLWSPDMPDVESFVAATREATFGKGEGLPGGVWAAGEPHWITDVSSNPNFPRGPEADAANLRGGLAFPITIVGQVAGVLEFFGRTPGVSDPQLLETTEILGIQIGQFILRTKAEQARLESETMTSAIVEAALDCIITIDTDGIVLDWNPAAERTFGYSASEAEGRELAALIVPEPFQELHRSGLRRFRESGETTITGQRLTLPAVRADGSEIHSELAITRVDIGGQPIFTGHLRDITETHRMEQELRFQKSLLEAQSEATPDGILMVAPDGTVLWSNRRFAELWGFDPHTFQTDPVASLWSILGEIEDIDHHLERVVHLFEHLEETSRTEIQLRDGRIFETHTSPVRGSTSSYYGRVWYFRDITEKKRSEAVLRESEKRFALLAEASNLLATSLDYTTTLEEVTRLAVPDLADWCLVDMVELDGTIQRAAVAHPEGDSKRDVQTIQRRYAGVAQPPRGVANVLRSGHPELYPDVDEPLMWDLALDEDHFTELQGFDIRSVMCVPMTARGRTLGVITFVSAESGRRYTPGDLRLAQDLAQRAAFAVDNARLYTERAHVARTLQHSLLPPSIPDIPGVEVAARYHPAGEGTEVGGDFYDVFQTGGGGWALVLGDVCGKGAEAAAITALARYTLRTAAMQERSPAKILTLLNEALLQNPQNDRFATALFARLETKRDQTKVTLACGGHPLPFIVRRDRTVSKAGRTGTALGLFEDADVADETIELRPGDSLVLYTDGVPEGRGPTAPFGEGMLISLLNWSAGNPASAIADHIVRTCVEFQKGRASDDIAVMVVRVPLP